MRIDVESRKILFTCLLLVAIFTIRFFSNAPLLVGGESYYSIRISDEIKKDPIIYNDPLGGEYDFSILHYLLAPFGNSVFIIPLILGLLSGFFYFKVLDKKYRNISTALLFISPLFLSVFTQLSSLMFATFLVLYNAYNINNRKIIAFTIVQTLLVLTHFEVWLFSSLYFLFRNKSYIAVIPGLLLSSLMVDFNVNPGSLFFELGSVQGYSLFLFLLGVIGFLWRKKNPSRALFLIAGLAVSFYLPDIRILGALVIIPYASRAIIKLISRKWELDHLKQATLFLIVLVIALSAISKSQELVLGEPNNIEVYESLKEENPGYVLAPVNYGHYIQYFSQKPVIIDSKSDREKILAINNLLSSQNIPGVLSELETLNVEYLLLPRSESRTGIYFVADNSPKLQLITAGKQELWQFIP